MKLAESPAGHNEKSEAMASLALSTIKKLGRFFIKIYLFLK